MKLWTVDNDKIACVVTAENVEVAAAVIQQRTGIIVTNSDLVPVVQTTRWCRVLHGVRPSALEALSPPLTQRDVWIARHVHARSHHRAECECKSCAYNGCTMDKPCELCTGEA